MKENIKLLIWHIPTVVSIIAATYCAINKIQGWGWFLFVGILVAVVPSRSNKEENRN